MSIEIVRGDLLDVTEGIVCHQVNCMGVMGSGVAKQLREKWPQIFTSYRNLCVLNECSTTLLGFVDFVQIEDNLQVANLFCQHNYGKDGYVFTNYDAIHKALKIVHDYALKNNLTIHLPWRMGCGLGGGDWEIVHGIIKEELWNMEVRIWKREQDD